MVKNIPNKDLIELFKSSMKEVSVLLNIPVNEIKRDEYIRCVIDNNFSPRIHKDNLTELGGFAVARNLFFPVPITQPQLKLNIKSEDLTFKVIKDNLKKYIELNNFVPTKKDYESFFKTKLNFKEEYSNMMELYNQTLLDYPELNENILNESMLTKEYDDKVNEKIKRYKRFVITTAVSGKKIHEGFYKALKNYSENNDALVLILPCEDIASRISEYQWQLPPKLKDFCVIHDDTYLNNNIFLSDIKVSAKQILPLTGLSRLAQKNGSMILASTKQFLEFIPTSNYKLPLAIMSTGAITENDYNSNDYYMSKRLSKIAENDHIIGAIVVEIESDEIFHFRQIQISDNNSIADLNTEYFSDGSIQDIFGSTAVFGDSHISVKDDNIHKEVKKIVYFNNIKDIFLHDIFDGECISHHIQNKPAIRAINNLQGISSIEKEGNIIKAYLEDVGSWIDGKIFIVRSNHDAFLDRYLEEGRFINDPCNLRYSLDLCKALIDGKNPLKFMMEEQIGISKDIEVKWLDYDEDYKISGIQMNNHGHLGPNGSKGSAKNIERCYEKSFICHSHSPCIHRGVYQTGTLSKLKLTYVKGPSAWIHCMGIIYPNGSRTLINMINHKGKYSWKI